MDDKKAFERRLSYFCWGLLMIWWGLRWSVLISLPEGSGLLGTSLICFGANLARKYAGLPTLSDNTFIGLFALLSGGVLFIFDILDFKYQAGVIEVFMITLGVLLVGSVLYSASRRMRVS